ncbi:MAG: type II toxin-antitoxin system RelE/ParE family toxin [Candidatus Omnitrophica bacterium]|nr:type II toxin-antitoxin system RelE/ParE family toxin [Candidatus Omnitrophota bacterium]MBI4435936.1 type II toxin-antitoxin system RelE/ParE family toxin [Candidatus Omnitrophota bacterium]
MADYEVLFYETADGKCPPQDFLEGLAPKVRGKVAKWLELLEREGPNLPRPYADLVRGKIRELRVSFGGLHHRFLYFFHGKRIVVTHGFVKKAAAIPEEELIKAQRCMADFEARITRGEIHP